MPGLTLPRPRPLSYSTNVHAYSDCSELRSMILDEASSVRRALDRALTLGLSIHLPAACFPTNGEDHLDASGWGISDLALQCRLRITSVNCFPYDYFHDAVVKKSVYVPTWADELRGKYTSIAAVAVAGMFKPGESCGISTLPLAWRSGLAEGQLEWCCQSLAGVVSDLELLEDEEGVLIHLDIEPEPGCVLQTASDLAAFFDGPLARHIDERRRRRYVRACHDVCHSAVMFEEQAAALAAYRSVGMRIGRIQVSSAISANLARPEHRQAYREVMGFCEPRYLHQTTLCTGDADPVFFDDLPDALATMSLSDEAPDRELRSHFHVPVFLDRIGAVGTTQWAIRDCLGAIRPEDDIRQFEVETYAWPVLPAHVWAGTLSEGIAAEISWLREEMRCSGFPEPEQ